MGDPKRRIIEVSDVRLVIVKPGAIYDTTNQDGFLDTFETLYPSDPPTLTIVYFTFPENPITMDVDMKTFLEILADEVKEIPSKQMCGAERQEPFSLASILPESGNTVFSTDLAHLLMHLLLLFAYRCCEPVNIGEGDDFPYEERVKINRFNPYKEVIGAFNFPTRTAHVHILADFIADYLHQWSKGARTTDFLERMLALAGNLDVSRKRTT